MTLTPSQQMSRWGLAIIVFIGILWIMGSVLTPYLVAMALAYFLDPVADRLENLGLSRLFAVVIITLSALILAVIFMILIVPTLVEQLLNLIDDIPQLIQSAQGFIETRFPKLDLGSSEILTRFQSALQSAGSTIANILLTSTRTAFGFIAMLVIVPVVTFFMLLDWDKLVAKIDSWLPRDHRDTIRTILIDIDKTLAGFIRGQGTVCLIMAIYYALVLWVVGLKYGIILGMIAGILTFIPYVGAMIGGGLVVGFALFQFWGAWPHLALILAVYFGGQSVEGNFITPNLVGKSVGLHPVWIMFSLSAFGSFLGLTGMLIGVPVAASIGVVGRYFLGQYQKGRLFLGQEFFEDRQEIDEQSE